MQKCFAGHFAWERARYKITFVYALPESVAAEGYAEFPAHDQGPSEVFL